ISPAAFGQMLKDRQRPSAFYWVDSDDGRMPIPHYLRCTSGTAYTPSSGDFTAGAHGKTYPMLLLDGSVVQRSAVPAVFPSGHTLSW
ncbi:MAG: hypothetical protein MUQ65_06480, partial [Armatimonadetes bacterium]|nr:hypothetical protein [Armatimonadota bacterium]